MRDLIYEAFDPRKWFFPSESEPSAGEALIWCYYLMERRDEELELCRLLFEAIQRIVEIHDVAVARNFLFCHWIMRLDKGFFAAGPSAGDFIVSLESELLPIFLHGAAKNPEDTSSTPWPQRL